MPLLDRLAGGLRALVWHRRVEQELDEELEAYLAETIDARVARGEDRESAIRAARAGMGSTAAVKDYVRDTGWESRVESVWQDAVYAVRTLRGVPAYVAAVVGVLALGVAASTAVFSLVYAVLLRPLPFPEADRIVRLSECHEGARSVAPGAVLSNLTFDAWRAAPRTLAALGVYSDRGYTVTGMGDAERVQATSVSPEVFRILGAAPARGRFLEEQDVHPGADEVVVLAFDFWHQRFAGREDVVGQTILLDSRPRRIVGIAPAGFSFPGPGRALYTPQIVPGGRTSNGEPQVRVFPVIARLLPGVTQQQAEAEGMAMIAALGPRPVSADLIFGQGGPARVRVRGLNDEATASVRPLFVLLSLGVALVFVVTCANAASLSLLRALSRGRELAIRAALGAGRARLIQQIVVESMLLALAGGALGLLLAWWLQGVWPALVPSEFPGTGDVSLGWRAATLALAMAVAAGLVAAAGPASLLERIRAALGRTEGGACGGRPLRLLRRGLLVAEVALAVVLVAGSVLLLRTYQELVSADQGYDATHAITARLSIQGSASAERWLELSRAVTERLEAMPSVEAAGTASMAPFGNATFMVGFRMPGPDPEGVIARAAGYVVSPGYSDALRRTEVFASLYACRIW